MVTETTNLYRIKTLIAEIYSQRPDRPAPITPEEMPDDQLLFDYEGTGTPSLELDSLDALEIAAALEDEFDIVFPSDLDPARIATPAQITTYLDELRGLDPGAARI